LSNAPTLGAFWAQYAFTVGRLDFLQLDVALAAMAAGEWARFERRLSEGLACVARATAEHLPPSQRAIDDAVIAFRYAHDLVSGADVSAWLDRAGMSTEAWMAFVTRDLLRRQWSDEIEDVLDRYGPSPRDLDAAAWAEGICSGLFAEFEHAFRGRAAIAFDADATSFPSQPHRSSSHADAAARLARQHAHWFEGIPAIDPRLRTILEIDDRYSAASNRLVTTESLLEVIEANRVDWVVLETHTLTFASEDAAREAKLCVTEDRLSLADVGTLSRQSLVRRRRFLSEVPGEHKHQLLSAEPGAIVGPLLVDGRFEVTAVMSRTAPALANAMVARRAREVVLEQLARRAARHVVCQKRDGA
jgi:hypothetical protein